jgi:hypothetical protein
MNGSSSKGALFQVGNFIEFMEIEMALDKLNKDGKNRKILVRSFEA